MKNESFDNGCAILSFDDIDYNKIAAESLKKDLVDWCKADREKWLRRAVNDIYDNLYLPTRKERFESLSEEEKEKYSKEKKPFGISMDAIKKNALYRYNIERMKIYGSPEKFIEVHGEYAFNRFFCAPDGHSKLDLRLELMVELIKNGFD
jgi:hypothetical protein